MRGPRLLSPLARPLSKPGAKGRREECPSVLGGPRAVAGAGGWISDGPSGRWRLCAGHLLVVRGASGHLGRRRSGGLDPAVAAVHLGRIHRWWLWPGLTLARGRGSPAGSPASGMAVGRTPRRSPRCGYRVARALGLASPPTRARQPPGHPVAGDRVRPGTRDAGERSGSGWSAAGEEVNEPPRREGADRSPVAPPVDPG